jgi:hypothetical protein
MRKISGSRGLAERSGAFRLSDVSERIRQSGRQPRCAADELLDLVGGGQFPGVAVSTRKAEFAASRGVLAGKKVARPF